MGDLKTAGYLPDEAECASCETTNINAQRDGHGVNEYDIAGYRVLLCANCWAESVVPLLIGFGVEPWRAMDFKSENEALEAGWDPEEPERHPYAEY